MRDAILICLFTAVVSLLCISLCVADAATEKLIKIDNYAVVVDAGSTGSRCFVFRVLVDIDDRRTVTGYPCGKVVPGLSSFEAYPEEASAYLAPLLINAAAIIPLHKQPTTIVHIKATAGMRLLAEESQARILKHLVYGLNYRIDIPFLISEYNVGTIDGHEEAFFAVLASNYIHGSIDGNLHPVDGMPMLGALDMGGSSTQLIFYNGSSDYKKVNADDFWSHSWLNYGVQRIQERVLSHLLTSYMAEKGNQGTVGSSGMEESSSSGFSTVMSNMMSNSDSNNDNSNLDGSIPDQDEQNSHRGHCPGPIIIPNPCSFIDYKLPYLSRFIFQGTGEGHKCMDIIERVIWPTLADDELKTACMRGRPCPIESIEHPSVRGHHFYAMSVYFYALDCMRQLGPEDIPHWPKPSLSDLETAAFRFCGWQWDELLHTFVHENTHPYTRESQLHDRCFESLYLITLLEKGFGFDRHERSITFALEVEGSEVEWTLGFALAEIDFRPHREKLTSTTFAAASSTSEIVSAWKYYIITIVRELLAPVKLILHLLHATMGVLHRLTDAFIRGSSHTLPTNARA